MGYVQTVRRKQETIIATAHIHWITFLRPGGLLLGGLLVAAFLSAAPEVAGVVAVIAIFIAGAKFVRAVIEAMTTEIAATDHRLIYKRGLVARDVKEIHFAKIESVDVQQSVLGRLLNYGDVSVQGTGSNSAAIRDISHPLHFRDSVLLGGSPAR